MTVFLNIQRFNFILLIGNANNHFSCIILLTILVKRTNVIITLCIVISEMKKNSRVKQKSDSTEFFPHRYQIIFVRFENG